MAITETDHGVVKGKNIVESDRIYQSFRSVPSPGQGHLPKHKNSVFVSKKRKIRS